MGPYRSSQGGQGNIQVEMKIRVYRRVVDGVLEVRVQTEDWGCEDVEKMRAFGEPEIDIGGKISCEASIAGVRLNGSNDESSYEYPNEFRKIMTGSPFVRRFDSRTVQDPETAAMLWKQEIVRRIMAAVEWLRSTNLSFDGEEVYNV